MRKHIFTASTTTIFIVAFYVIFFSNNAHLYGTTCGYEDRIVRCSDANKSGDPRSLDFLCIQDNDAEKRAYQIVLDGEFSQIDNQIEDYLNSLEQQKNRFYSGGETYLDAYDEITLKLGINGQYWNEYQKLCSASNSDGVLQKTLACRGGESTITQASDFFQESSCMQLVDIKLSLYRDVADNIVYLNKAYTVQTQQTSYLSTQTDTYSSLLDKFTYNLGLLHKIVKKYQSRNSWNEGPK